HDEGEEVAAFGAGAKAAPRLGFGEDKEGRGAAVGVKRAKASIVSAGLFEGHGFGNKVNDIESAFNILSNAHSYLGTAVGFWQICLRPVSKRDYTLVWLMRHGIYC